MNNGLKNKFIIIGFFVLIVWWITIENYPAPSEDYNSSYEEYVKDNFQNIDKLHWTHMPVTFSFVEPDLYSNIKCQDYQIKRIRQAFSEIEAETEGIVFFTEIEEEGDIKVYCYGAIGEEGYMTSGEGGYEAYGNEITKGILNFYTHRNCGTWPDVEIHEILHVFGYNHVEDEWSIMNPIQSRCDLGKIDEEIINDLIKTYS